MAERCPPLLARVNLTYRITATPSAGGNEIGLHMTLENESEVPLAGSTGGVLQVSPGPKSNQINWGGSSADELYQKPRNHHVQGGVARPPAPGLAPGR